MTSKREIAGDPHKALTALEKRLGVEPGTLLREMDRLGEPNEDWTQHLPYGVAGAYYDDAATRAPYEAHVEGCAYCQELLQTLHPTSLQVDEFTKSAKQYRAN